MCMIFISTSPIGLLNLYLSNAFNGVFILLLLIFTFYYLSYNYLNLFIYLKYLFSIKQSTFFSLTLFRLVIFFPHKLIYEHYIYITHTSHNFTLPTLYQVPSQIYDLFFLIISCAYTYINVKMGNFSWPYHYVRRQRQTVAAERGIISVFLE